MGSVAIRPLKNELNDLKQNNVPHSDIKKAVELLMCLRGSNGATERVALRMNWFRSEEKSRVHSDTTQATLAQKMDTDLSREAFSDKLASNPGVVKKVQSSDKYHVIARLSSLTRRPPFTPGRFLDLNPVRG
jgi:hypothetical protein